MRRTYVDILGEYYDNDDDLEALIGFGLSEADIRRVFETKASTPRYKLRGE